MSQPTPPPVVNPKPKPSKSFGLPEAAVCVALVVVVVIGAVKSSGASIYAASELIGRLVGAILASAIVAFVVRLCTQAKAPKAWVWTFACTLVAIAMISTSFSQANSDAKTKIAITDLKDEIVRARGNGPAGSRVDVDRMDRAADEFAAAAGGRDRVVAQMTADFIKYSAQIGRSAQDALQKFQTAGGMDVASITTAADCEKRIAAVTEYDLVARANFERARGIEAEIDRLAKVHGVGFDDLQEFKRGISKSASLEKVVRVRQIDVESAEQFRAYFTLLHDNFNKWKVQDKKVMFSEPKLLPTFNEIVVKIQTLSAEQNKLLGELSQPTP
ncbi:MAG: hypothetical protein ACREJO_09160 [Phycisphaerales bacterium]